MRALLWLLVLNISAELSSAQKLPVFRSPVSYSTRLSGSYGEPRSAHFHAGIDFKQRYGVPRDTIYAVADGYVSKIYVHPWGYGNGLAITHPNGYTSVYGHLHDYSPEIRSVINRRLRSKRIHHMTYDASRDSLQVKEGQYIGIMGNTGRSSAAHLHFEIRRSADDTPVNPALFGLKPPDTQYPTVKGIIIYGLTPDGEVLDQNYYRVVPQPDGTWTTIPEKIQSAHPIVGIGVHCYDTMNGARNHNGIYGLRTTINGQERYAFELQEIPSAESKYIHSHMDYSAKKSNLYYTKSYRAPGNGMSIYSDSTDNGIVLLSDIFPSTVNIEVYDIERNTVKVTFSVHYDSDVSSSSMSAADSTFTRGMPFAPISLKGDNHEAIFPVESVDAPAWMKLVSISDREVDLLGLTEVAFFEHGRLYFNDVKKEECDRCVITSTGGNGQTKHRGALWRGDTLLYTLISDLGRYRVEQDTVAPTVRLLDLPDAIDQRLAFIITDNFVPSFKKHYLDFDITIDGEWQLCQYDIKNDKVTCQVKALQRGGDHELIIRVRDAVKNETVVKRSIRG